MLVLAAFLFVSLVPVSSAQLVLLARERVARGSSFSKIVMEAVFLPLVTPSPLPPAVFGGAKTKTRVQECMQRHSDETVLRRSSTVGPENRPACFYGSIVLSAPVADPAVMLYRRD